MGKAAFIRARRPEQKQLRREAILDAARELARESGVQNVSLGGVAAAVGLAKSNVVRYFGTREEIYLELAAEAWQDWAEEAVRLLAAGEDPVQVLSRTLTERPFFCDLLSQTSITLEHNVSVEAARTYKRTALHVIATLGDAVAAAHPVLNPGEGVELVSAACALAGALHPVVNPPPTMRELYAQDPDLAATCPRMMPTLVRALSAFALGLPGLR
ncbi:TetR/AcrR family transcriptional regulator [Acrocarpospora catenulata]|uniref:TetR/AcrR family transcriptional regulator n=1 Tax=Acrocarpospora catenulata TaxID=2836182 RepID=UPI001BDA1FA9|nr:TetR/AcrR family transcriptional regulator [Acrocarpospora catenulata]